VTYNLPGEFTAFADDFLQRSVDNKSKDHEDGSNLWIIKPVGLSRGRGISVVRDVGEVPYGDPAIVQKYIENPLLLEGFKWDLRLYVLVTSFAPLEAFLYQEGFGRISSQPYNLDHSNLKDSYVHLTNSSINKNAPSIPACLRGAPPTAAGGNKCSLAWLWKQLEKIGVDTKLVWNRIIEVILRTLLCVEDVLGHPNSFEVFGFDVMVDAELKAWLIEINSSPSLAIENPLDEMTKVRMVTDTLRIVQPATVDRAQLLNLIQRRMGDHEKPWLAKGNSTANVLDNDIDALLGGGLPPRAIGEPPPELGGYECIAPSRLYDSIARYRRPPRGTKAKCTE